MQFRTISLVFVYDTVCVVAYSLGWCILAYIEYTVSFSIRVSLDESETTAKWQDANVLEALQKAAACA